MAIKFTISKCKTKASYAAKLAQKGRMDLEKIKNQFEVILETPILVVVRVEGVEVIIHSYGELLFKKVRDVELIERIAAEIYAQGLQNQPKDKSAPGQI